MYSSKQFKDSSADEKSTVDTTDYCICKKPSINVSLGANKHFCNKCSKWIKFNS